LNESVYSNRIKSINDLLFPFLPAFFALEAVIFTLIPTKGNRLPAARKWRSHQEKPVHE